MAKVEVKLPSKQVANKLKFLEGELETSLSDDFGQGEWDNPVRVFQDMVQNHLDADPEGSNIRLIVMRDGQEHSIFPEEILEADEIIGLDARDFGQGYPPELAATMGDTSKQSAIYAGKYGEGLKMLAAAVVRGTGLTLQYSSISEFEGEKYRWNCVAGGKPQPLITGGEKIQTQRVKFDLTSKKAGAEEFTSSTILKVSPNATPEQLESWRKWAAIIDPRNTDAKGNPGLSRYIRRLRPKEQNHENEIDLGFMKILLDEPGVIYENGIRISTGEPYAFGYDVPDVTDGRDRNSFNSKKLERYIAFAMLETTDTRLIDKVILGLAQAKVGYKGNLDFLHLPQDIRLGRIINYKDPISGMYQFKPNSPIWRERFEILLPDKYLVSEERLQEELRHAQKNRNSVGKESSPEMDGANQKIGAALVALDLLRHLPAGSRMNLDIDDYRDMSILFPTISDFAMEMSLTEVTTTPETITELKKLASSCAKRILAVVTELASTESSEYMTSLVNGLEINQILKDNAEAQRRLSLSKTIFVNSIKYEAEGWIHNSESKKLFVAPSEAGYLGVATVDKLGIKETMLESSSFNKAMLVGVMLHELIHKIMHLPDYNLGFLFMLLELIESLQSKPVRSNY